MAYAVYLNNLRDLRSENLPEKLVTLLNHNHQFVLFQTIIERFFAKNFTLYMAYLSTSSTPVNELPYKYSMLTRKEFEWLNQKRKESLRI